MVTDRDETGGRGLDPAVPNVARVYDYLLGGKENFEADRELAAQLLASFPTSGWIARQNRAFLVRAVRYCAENGIRQFLDLGSGLPSVDSVHEVARRVNPDARVTYVDHDPVAVRHAQALLAGGQGLAAIEADLRFPERVLELARLDFAQPVAVLTVAVMHFIGHDDNPGQILREFIAAMAPGSYLVLSHATHDTQPEDAGRARSMYRRASSPLNTRSREEIAALFGGLALVDPGLVFTVQWRPGGHAPADQPEAAGMYAGVGYKSRP